MNPILFVILVTLVPQQDEGEQAFNRAVQLFGRRLYHDAETAFLEAARHRPDSGQVWHGVAMCQYQTKRYELSLKAFAKACASENPEAQFFTNHGVALEIIGRPREALPLFDEAIKLDATFYNAWFNAGRVNARLGNRKVARDQLEKVLTIKKDHSEAIYELAHIAFREKRLDDAERLAKRCADLDATNFASRHLLSRILFRRGKKEEARTLSELAAELQRKSSDDNLRNQKISGLMNLAYGHLRKREFPQAVGYFRVILQKHDPRHTPALRAMGQIRAAVRQSNPRLAAEIQKIVTSLPK